MPPHLLPGRHPQRARRLHVLVPHHLQDRPAHQPGELGQVGDADGHDRAGEAGPQDGDDDERQQQVREREHHVRDAHQQVVDPAPIEPGHQPDQHAADRGDAVGHQAR